MYVIYMYAIKDQNESNSKKIDQYYLFAHFFHTRKDIII